MIGSHATINQDFCYRELKHTVQKMSYHREGGATRQRFRSDFAGWPLSSLAQAFPLAVSSPLLRLLRRQPAPIYATLKKCYMKKLHTIIVCCYKNIKNINYKKSVLYSRLKYTTFVYSLHKVH